ncbi:hypothetical protein GCM10022295_56500 [Streptomyces osmaniensis]|uniref:Uncharacterized protein n=1 Tax=Streptomyces osmaniensis TaxID=593134 RepID=A0ABP6XHQ7_9ACTN
MGVETRFSGVGTPWAGRGDALFMWDIREERVGMWAFDARSVVLPRVRAGADVGAKVTSGTYNPPGGTRVQQAWQRYSTSVRRPAVRPYGRPAGPSDPACPVRPAACR